MREGGVHAITMRVRAMLALTGKPSRAKPGIELRGLDITLAFMPLYPLIRRKEGLARLFRQAKSWHKGDADRRQ